MMAVRQSEREVRGNGSESGTCTRTWSCIGAGDCRLNHAASEGQPWNGINRYYGHMNGRKDNGRMYGAGAKAR